MKGIGRIRFGIIIAGWLMLIGIINLPAQAQQLSDKSALVNIRVQILPIAELQLLDTPLLYMRVPPPGSTVNTSNSVRFLVRGNALATVSAIPEGGFMYVPAEDSYMGKALLPPNNEEIGYRIQLTFPSTGPGQRSAYMPGTDGAGTEPPLAVNLTTAKQREGRIDLQASHAWTSDGSLPPVGIYEGSVLITVVASSI